MILFILNQSVMTEKEDMVVVSVTGRDIAIMWDEIDAVSQNEILQAIHCSLSSDLNMEVLHSEDPVNLA